MAVTITQFQNKTIQVVSFDWVSNSAGAASGATSFRVAGKVNRIITDPDATNVPDASYDIVINDEESIDVAGGLLANRSATSTEEVFPTIGTYFQRAVNDYLTVSVTNSGSGKQGEVKVYVETG